MTRPNQKKQKQGGGSYAALIVLALVLLSVGGYLLFSPDSETSKTVQAPPPPIRMATPPPSPRPPVPPTAGVAPKTEEKPVYPVAKPAPEAAVPVPPVKGSGPGKLAIIIDDMGANLQEARSLAAIGVPLTFSIIPGLRSYREVASFAAANGMEIMIHIPMQSKGWPERRLEANGLLVSMQESAIREHIEGFCRDIPRAVGANNHMGSEFTEHEAQMRAVLEVLQGKGLFFIDSVTSPHSVGQKLAREMGIRTARRQVFLDNEQDAAYIVGQLDQAVRMAKKNGAAIAICHPHPMTIRTLAAALPALQHQGIAFVPASQLVK